MRSGPFQSYELAVSVANLAELKGYAAFVDGGPCRVLSTGELWIWRAVLPAGVLSSSDGSSGATASWPDGFWVLDGVQSSAVCSVDTSGDAPDFYFNRGFAGAVKNANGDYTLTLATQFPEESTLYAITLLDSASTRLTYSMVINDSDQVSIRVKTYENAVLTNVDFQLALKRIAF